jgi:hypothetical protein
MFINFLVSICPYYPEISKKLENNFKKITKIIERNRNLFIWFVWYVIKGNNYLTYQLSNLSNLNILSSSSFPQYSLSLYSQYYQNLNQNLKDEKFNIIFDFFVNKLLSKVNFSRNIELILGIDCFIQICKESPYPINKTEYIVECINKQLRSNKIDCCIYILNRFLPENGNIDEYILIKDPHFEIICTSLELILKNKTNSNLLDRYFKMIFLFEITQKEIYRKFEKLLKIYSNNIYYNPQLRDSLISFVKEYIEINQVTLKMSFMLDW